MADGGMSEDLGLGLHHEPPRHRQRRRRSGLAILTILVVLLLLLVGVVVVVGRAIGGIFGNPDYSGNGTGNVLVVVHPGDSASTIGHTLVTDGVVKSTGAFTSAASDNSRSQDIGPGTYRLHRHMSAAAAVNLLLSPASQVDYTVVIPEGFTAADIAARIASATPISAAAIRSALHLPGSLGLPSYANGKVEGLLFPATYQVQPGTTATELLRTMVARFQEEATSANLTQGA